MTVTTKSTKYCRACHQKISVKARRCQHCNVWQGKRFWFGEVTVYSVAVLLVAVAGVGVGFYQAFERIGKNQEEIRILGAPYEFAFRRWKEENVEFIQNTGDPGKRITPISILWYQFFETGYILYNASQGWSIILNANNKNWREVENDSAILISHYNKEEINKELLKHFHDGERYEYYLNLFKEGSITGGIGNLYVKHDLGPSLGKPLQAEMWIEDSGFVRGDNYDLIVGVINRPTDHKDSIVRAVYALMNDDTYRRFVITNRSKK